MVITGGERKDARLQGGMKAFLVERNRIVGIGNLPDFIQIHPTNILAEKDIFHAALGTLAKIETSFGNEFHIAPGAIFEDEGHPTRRANTGNRGRRERKRRRRLGQMLHARIDFLHDRPNL